jgi:hypothetical protein
MSAQHDSDDKCVARCSFGQSGVCGVVCGRVMWVEAYELWDERSA